VFQQWAVRLRRFTSRTVAPAAATDGRPVGPFTPRGRTHYADATTTVVGRTLTSPNGMFRIAELSGFRPVPLVEPRERAKDATLMTIFVGGLFALVAVVTYGIYVIMSSRFGDLTLESILATAIVAVVILTVYTAVVVARWRVVYDRDPARYRHVIVALHRGERVAITPDMPYEAAGQIVTVLRKVKRKIPKADAPTRRSVAA